MNMLLRLRFMHFILFFRVNLLRGHLLPRRRWRQRMRSSSSGMICHVGSSFSEDDDFFHDDLLHQTVAAPVAAASAVAIDGVGFLILNSIIP
ncbi:hypothetical protein OIU74_004969 [Salix koriyanagi]|uniref:Secreted protein n=1 Tax=Salix koriyanagi TaxID=2511006 RepID=A0A9Q0UMY3_9ROSI|nr:hypothetical protein OIU74_004969 [Salix koriyanagi]